MIRAGTWTAPSVEPHWQETEPRKRKYRRKGTRASETTRAVKVRNDFTVTAGEVAAMMKRWGR